MKKMMDEAKEALNYTLHCIVFVIRLYIYIITILPAVVINSVKRGIAEAEAIEAFAKRKREN